MLLTKPLENSSQIRITLEANDTREVPVKRRNPFTLVFVIPGMQSYEKCFEFLVFKCALNFGIVNTNLISINNF